jgi:hypothetical protein
VRTLLIALAAVISFGDIDAGGWSAWKTREGVTLERRSVDGAKFYEHRAFVDLPSVAPAAAADSIWDAIRNGDMEALKSRKILAAGADEMLIYDQIKTPIVDDRDYTFTVKRVRTGARTDFVCETANDRGPPPQKGLVRIPVLVGGWRVEPDGHGGTRLGYFAYSEPGGSVPAFLVRGAQADRSVADVVRMVARLRALAAPR